MLLYIDKTELKQLLERHPFWLKTYINALENAYVRENSKRLMHVFDADLEEKIKTFMKTESKMLQRVEQKHIASYLGMTLETFSKIKRRILIGSERLN